MSHEDGLSLIEMMVAILVLGVALTAFAQVLMGSLRATREARDTQIVTAASMELIEEMLALPWSEAALYEGEISAAPSTWSARLDSATVFDGEALITRPGPVDDASRHPAVPHPSQTEVRDGVEYTFDVYPVWVDRSQAADDIDDTKRFVVVASWDDPVRGPQVLETSAERAPSQAEAGSTASGVRFMSTYASPSPVNTQPDGSLPSDISLVARSNRGLLGSVEGVASWEAPTFDAGGTHTGWQTVEQDVTLDAALIAPDGSGHVRFEGSFSRVDGGGAPHLFGNGAVTVSLRGTPAGGGDDVTTTLSFVVRNSPFGPEEEGGDDGDAAEIDRPEYGGPPTVSIDSVSNVCAAASDSRLIKDIVIDMTIANVDPASGIEGSTTYIPADAAVSVDYDYWDPGSSTADEPTSEGSVTADFEAGTLASSQWEGVIQAEAGKVFAEHGTMEFTATVFRSSDANNSTDLFGPVTVVKKQQANQC